jgi:predicted nucleotide-binding protein (sugar kinase/HSP70/actin superfamily)
MRVGIPRALLYYRYGKFWERFLTELGVEPVVSRRTDKELLQEGLRHVSSEVCLPIKIVAGHIADLKGKVDAVFLPRMLWQEDKLYACPKMIGIVDIARMMLDDGTRLVAPPIRRNLLWSHYRAGVEICGNPVLAVRALLRARSELASESAVPRLPPGENRIALIGHFYNVGDDYVGRPIVSAFRNHGYRPVTKDELPEVVLRSRRGFARNIRWVFERELYNAFRFLVGGVDGVCVLVSMGCGPDSLVAEFMKAEAAERGVPFLQLILDEHTGTAGLNTRIEAFLELAQRRRQLTRAA